ncbi:hypothetical protein [Martelella mediterranea]|uniref:Uncharacterized protein n=1 Tax=Martelella mediterranea TaxID=293089 RepID=A0A4R3NK09_9HYPH|nr:hypothetical protein [Martelella mediterranea]TCT34660.1 hypothetical protein EDC90_103354 [Martelella mediterranea]
MTHAFNGAIARILLRYGAGALTSWGLGNQLARDPDIVNLAATGIGISIAAGTEIFYKVAKRNGWKL